MFNKLKKIHPCFSVLLNRISNMLYERWCLVLWVKKTTQQHHLFNFFYLFHKVFDKILLNYCRRSFWTAAVFFILNDSCVLLLSSFIAPYIVLQEEMLWIKPKCKTIKYLHVSIMLTECIIKYYRYYYIYTITRHSKWFTFHYHSDLIYMYVHSTTIMATSKHINTIC